ncbi:MAG: hypothetical protein ACTSYR_04460, partial [Candidatus Odinarchaeia archaeon]
MVTDEKDKPYHYEVRDKRVKEAKEIIDKALSRKITLKLIGGLAVRNHCEIIDFCERDYLDIDMVGLSKQIKGIKEIFQELG